MSKNLYDVTMNVTFRFTSDQPVEAVTPFVLRKMLEHLGRGTWGTLDSGEVIANRLVATNEQEVTAFLLRGADPPGTDTVQSPPVPVAPTPPQDPPTPVSVTEQLAQTADALASPTIREQIAAEKAEGPDAVTMAREFVDTMCTLDDNLTSRWGPLNQSYKLWCEKHGYPIATIPEWRNLLMDTLGLDVTSDGRMVEGIGFGG